MSWVKVDDGLYMHPKAIAAGVPALGLWVRCLAYAAAHMTDGFVPSDAAYGVVTRRSRLPDDLVRAGLWLRDDALNGWWIHDYLVYNRSRAQLLSERDEKKKAGLATAERRWKAVAPAIAAATPSATPSATDISIALTRGRPVPVPERKKRESAGEREPEPRVTVVRDETPAPKAGPLPRGIVNLERSGWIATYELAVSDERDTAWGFPEKAFSALVKVVETFCLGEDRKSVQAWLERDVRAFVRAVNRREDDPSRWSSFGPDGLLRWHNERCPGLPGRRDRDEIKNSPQVEALLAARPCTPEERAEKAEITRKMLLLLNGGPS
jgi:hypothetical protein